MYKHINIYLFFLFILFLNISNAQDFTFIERFYNISSMTHNGTIGLELLHHTPGSPIRFPCIGGNYSFYTDNGIIAQYDNKTYTGNNLGITPMSCTYEDVGECIYSEYHGLDIQSCHFTSEKKFDAYILNLTEKNIKLFPDSNISLSYFFNFGGVEDYDNYNKYQNITLDFNFIRNDITLKKQILLNPYNGWHNLSDCFVGKLDNSYNDYQVWHYLNWNMFESPCFVDLFFPAYLEVELRNITIHVHQDATKEIRLQFQNLTISDINITTIFNQLPSINVTLNNTGLCINDSSSGLNIGLNITSLDFENNTILYATNFLNSRNLNKTKIFNKRECLFGIDFLCSDSVVYRFWEGYSYFNVDSCFITEIGNYNVSFLGYFGVTKYTYPEISTTIGGNLEGDSKYMLSMDYDTCIDENDKSAYYNFGYPIYNLFYVTDIWDFETPGEEFNISFIKQNIKEAGRLIFKVGDTNISVFEFQLNDSVSRLLYSFTNSVNNRNPMEIYINGNSSFTGSGVTNTINSYRLLITNIVPGELQNFHLYNVSDGISYIGFTMANQTRIYQEYFRYSALTNELNFSQNIPLTSIFLTGQPYNYIFYVTDSKHFSSEYNYFVLNGQLPLCSNSAGSVVVLGTENINFGIISSTFKSINNLGCNIVSLIALGMGFDINLCSYMFLIFMLISLVIAGFAVSFAILTRVMYFILPEIFLLVFSISSFVFYFFCDYPNWYTAIVSILFVLGFIWLIINLFFIRNNNNTEVE